MPPAESVDLRWLMAVVRRWLWLIALCLLLALLGAYLVTSWMPPAYRASTTLLVRPASGTSLPNYQELLTSERMARTYSEMLTEWSVLETVIRQLDLADSPTSLQKRIKVELIEGTQLLRLSVDDSGPASAAQTANALAQAFIDSIQLMQTEQYGESLASIKAQADELAGEINLTQARIDAIGKEEGTSQRSDLIHLETLLAGYRNTYSALLQSYEQMRLTSRQSEQSVSIVEVARPPELPIQRRSLYLALAGLVGIMVGMGAAFLIESLDDSIRSPEQMEAVLSLPTLGLIGQLPRGEPPGVLAARPYSPHSEAFRALCNRIFLAVEHDRPRTLLVTSPGPTEGKSFTAANLAMALAQTGLRVVAVDADLRRGSLGAFFGLPPRQAGLSMALLQGSVDGLLQPTSMPRLSVLTGGQPPANPAQLISSEGVRRVLEALIRQVDVAVIDGPPALTVAETALLAHEADGVLLVVRSGRTRERAAQHALGQLRQMGANVIGAALNGVPAHDSNYYYAAYRYEPNASDVRTRLAASVKNATAAQAIGTSPDHTDRGAHTLSPMSPGAAEPPRDTTMPDAPDYATFAQRDLSELQVAYLFLGALRSAVGGPTAGQPMLLCAWAICSDGPALLLHVMPAEKVSYEAWREFLSDMLARGLRAPVLVVAHSAPGLAHAVAELLPSSMRQRALPSKVRAVTASVPAEARMEVTAAVRATYYAPTRPMAELNAANLREAYGERFPHVVAALADDWEACVAYMRCPPAHHRRLRTTSLLRRSLRQERRRSGTGAPTAHAPDALQQAFAQMWRASQRWECVDWGEAESRRLAQLRYGLGLVDAWALAEVPPRIEPVAAT